MSGCSWLSSQEARWCFGFGPSINTTELSWSSLEILQVPRCMSGHFLFFDGVIQHLRGPFLNGTELPARFAPPPNFTPTSLARRLSHPKNSLAKCAYANTVSIVRLHSVSWFIVNKYSITYISHFVFSNFNIFYQLQIFFNWFINYYICRIYYNHIQIIVVAICNKIQKNNFLIQRKRIETFTT